MPNQALNDGDIDLNAFQHHAYFYNETNTKGYNLSIIGLTFISAMNIYSQKISNVNEIKRGDKIAIPNNPSNKGRALKVLQAAGLIKLKDNAPDNKECSIAKIVKELGSIIESRIGNNPVKLYIELDEVKDLLFNVSFGVGVMSQAGKNYAAAINSLISASEIIRRVGNYEGELRVELHGSVQISEL